MQPDIAIVIAAYNRPWALKRLLFSIKNAQYGNYFNIPLVISIDKSDNEDCRNVADTFEWLHGEKIILSHDERLGLKKHIISCGDILKQYEAIIMLEDDLFVSPFYFDYAQQAIAFYKASDKIAGIGLYHHTFNECALCPFDPVTDGYDNYFMQVPCSWGQLWTVDQWMSFKKYLENEITFSETDLLPANVLAWPSASSWKKFFYRYMVDEDKYFVYPRIGLSTNFGESGEHLVETIPVFQSPLLVGKKQFHFSELHESTSVYDAFFELNGNVYNKISGKDISVSFDLNATKPLRKINTEYLVSSKKCNRPETKIPLTLYPYENNVLLGNNEVRPGEPYFSLAKKEYFAEEKVFDRINTDVKRVFLNGDTLTRAGRYAAERSMAFRIGSFILKPYYFLKKRKPAKTK